MPIVKLECPTCGATLPEDLKPGKGFTCPSCNSSLAWTDLLTGDRILCTKCYSINASDVRYCTACGALLTIECPFCHTVNETSGNYCRRCGNHLKLASRLKDLWIEQKEQYDAERRAALQETQAGSREAELRRLLDLLAEPEQHGLAAALLRDYGPEALRPVLAELESEQPNARLGAVRALGAMGDPRAIPALVEALGDAKANIRYWAADALGALHAEAAVPALSRLLRDEHKQVREHAMAVLRQIGGPEAERVLRQAVRPRWWPF